MARFRLPWAPVLLHYWLTLGLMPIMSQSLGFLFGRKGALGLGAQIARYHVWKALSMALNSRGPSRLTSVFT